MQISFPQILFQIINFSLLMVMLTKLLYKPILKIIDERAKKIKEGLEAAEKNIKLQTQTQQETNKIIAEAKKEAEQLVKDAKVQASAIVNKAKTESKTESKAILEKDRKALSAQIAKQSQELEQRLSSLVAQATEAVLKNTVDTKLQKSIIDKQIKTIDISLFN